MTPLSWPLLIAQVNSKAPRPGDWRFGWLSVGIIAAGALAIIFCVWLIGRWLATRQRRNNHSPWGLFGELCTAHGVSHRERQLLTRLAQHFRLEQPTLLFVEPAWWEAERLGPIWSSRSAEIDKLRKRLFAVR